MPEKLNQIIKLRRSVRSFTNEAPKKEDIDEIAASAMYAPYALAATGLPINEVRKVFILTGRLEKEARDLLISQTKKNAGRINMMMTLLPFLRKKIGPFVQRLKSISGAGIPSLNGATYYIIIAEKKGFPPVEKQSIAHAMQNMWLTATDKGLGFQLLSATGAMSRNRQFLKLLGLPVGEYGIDGCVVGYAANKPEAKVIDTSKCVNWVE
ncbi:MAG: nitroreductase family protein [Brevinematales bacterium]